MVVNPPGQPRLDMRAVIAGLLVAAIISVAIWFIRSHAQRTAGRNLQPIVTKTATKE